MLFILVLVVLGFVDLVFVGIGIDWIFNLGFLTFYDKEEKTFKERVKNKKISIIIYSVCFSISIALTILFSFLFISENKKVNYEMVYKDYVAELYSFTDDTQESIHGNSSYFLFIGGGSIYNTSEYKITFLFKTKEGLYQRKTILINEKASDIKIYYNIQKDKNVQPKLITRTESYSESYAKFWWNDTKEKIISYTFIIPENSIQYDNVLNN